MKASAPGTKETTQQLATFVGQQSTVATHGVVEPCIGRKQIEDTARRPGTWISGPEDDTTDARVNDRTGTHRAGFEGHVQGAAGKTIITEPSRCIAQCNDLGVSRRVMRPDRSIPTLADHVAVQGE